MVVVARTGAALLALAMPFASAQTSAPPQVSSYAPVNVTCPTRLLRNAGTHPSSNQSLNPNEASYVENRRFQLVGQAFQSYLSAHDTGYDVGQLVPNSSYWPTVGIAASGGGFRASLVAAGTWNALDGRNASSVQAGTGGILQLASYMAGLSGGSWHVGSFAINDMPMIQDLVLGGNGYQGWFLEYNLVLPDGVLSLFDNRDYYDNLQMNLELKQNAGFNTSLTDLWGIALAYHFGPGGTTSDNFYSSSQTEHNTATQWSGIRSASTFQNYSMPFPLVAANSRPPNYFPIALNQSTVYIPLNSTVFEFNPYEFGSWDTELAHFVNVDYVGTELYRGSPPTTDSCVTGFSNFGFTIGTSSSLFNAIVQTANATLLGLGDGDGIVEGLLDSVLADAGLSLRNSEDDLAIYPNSFRGINPGEFPRSSDDGLQLVDGGENGCNIPLDSLLAPARKVDTILAVDASADTDYYWPNATSLRASYARQASITDNSQIPLPYFPSAETFVNEGLNARTTFFGCNASSEEISSGMPMVIYMPNAPSGGSYTTNVSTYTLEYSREDTQSFLDSMFATQTRGYAGDANSLTTVDSQYGVCLACGLVERRRQAAGLARSSACETCFSRYCYDAGPTSTSMLAQLRTKGDAVYSQDSVMHP